MFVGNKNMFLRIYSILNKIASESYLKLFKFLHISFYSPGEPLSEKQLRGNTSIRVLSEEEQEGVRVASRVSDHEKKNLSSGFPTSFRQKPGWSATENG